MTDTPSTKSSKLQQYRAVAFVAIGLNALMLAGVIAWFDVAGNKKNYNINELVCLNLGCVVLIFCLARAVWAELSLSLDEQGLSKFDFIGRRHVILWEDINEIRFSSNSITLVSTGDKMKINPWIFKDPDAMYEFVKEKNPWLNLSSRESIHKR